MQLPYCMNKYMYDIILFIMNFLPIILFAKIKKTKLKSIYYGWNLLNS